MRWPRGVRLIGLIGLIGLVGLGACDSSEQPPGIEQRPTLLRPAELQRAAEACDGYVAKVCACAETVSALKDECAMSKALPEAIDIARRLASSPKAEAQDAVPAAANVRKTVQRCIENTAKLPAQGCP